MGSQTDKSTGVESYKRDLVADNGNKEGKRDEMVAMRAKFTDTMNKLTAGI